MTGPAAGRARPGNRAVPGSGQVKVQVRINRESRMRTCILF